MVFYLFLSNSLSYRFVIFFNSPSVFIRSSRSSSILAMYFSIVPFRSSIFSAFSSNYCSYKFVVCWSLFLWSRSILSSCNYCMVLVFLDWPISSCNSWTLSTSIILSSVAWVCWSSLTMHSDLYFSAKSSFSFAKVDDLFTYLSIRELSRLISLSEASLRLWYSDSIARFRCLIFLRFCVFFSYFLLSKENSSSDVASF